jgi:acid phosphatase family membrane protein YuiD
MMDKGIVFGNSILDVVVLAWFAAQAYKVISTLFVEKKLALHRFLETGGMPSSHSSTVSALATSVAIVYGPSSTLFAITVVFAVIVIHDAAGIRQAAGNQARKLNRLEATLHKLFEEQFKDERLKELLGHTKIEVLVGIIVGIAVAFIFRFHLV